MNAQAPGVQLVNTYNGFSNPVDLTNANDGTDRLFVVEQGGDIKIMDANGATLATPFLTVPGVVAGGERGLLGLAFHPDYATNGYFYVNFTTNISGQLHTRIARYTVSPSNINVADVSSGVTLLDFQQPFSNHNAGDLNFGPDGFLYIATGDGGSGGDPNCEAQDPFSLLGKVLRLEVDQNINTVPYFGIPSDNPYLGTTTHDEKIWAVGLRNPFRCSFDRVTGDFWIADVGQGQREEINKQSVNSTGAENYGWKVMEGNNCYDPDPIDMDCVAGVASCNDPSYTMPVFDYPHDFSTGGVSVTGGFVYRGCEYPLLYGYYLCADYVSNNVWALNADGSVAGFYPNISNNISSFGEDEEGELYAVSLNGEIYRVTETGASSDCSCPLDDMINSFAQSGVYNAENDLTSNAVVEEFSTVIFRAGNTITLENGFEVELNADFITEIFDCAAYSPYMENPNTKKLVEKYLEMLKEESEKK